MEIIQIPIEDLTPDPMNAKAHPDWQIEQIVASIEQFGNLDPIGVWGDDNIIVEGHGRYEALKELGYHEAECIRLDWLTEEERRAYALAHNKLTMNSGFIPEALDMNLDAIGEIDMAQFGFRSEDWFSDRERNDTSRQEGNDEYNEFLDKFEQPKTIDDCYTPDNIYDVIAEYVENKYGKSRDNFVRPFFPGGDYQRQKYKKADVVVDNPPFSILAEIIDFYVGKKQPFFLFASGLSTLGYITRENVAAICCYAGITYENGASVTTSFVTNLESADVAAIADPDLYKRIEEVNKENEAATHRNFPKYEFPHEVLTAAKMGYLSKYGQAMTILRKDSMFIRALDAMKESGKGIYGSALLLSERAAAERAAATCWQLSEREQAIVKSLGGEDNDAG